MSITTQTADLYALLNDLTVHINGHYQVIEENEVTRVKFCKGTLYDVRWVSENIAHNLPYCVREIRPYNGCGFELILKESAAKENY